MPTRAAPNQTSKRDTFRQNLRRFKSVEAALHLAKDLGVPGSISNFHSIHPSHRCVSIKKEILS